MTNTARTGQTLLIAASSMFFAAFTSAMVVRRGLGEGDWAAPSLPGWVWLTMLLGPLASWLLHRERTGHAAAAGALLVASQVALLASLRMAAITEAFFTVLIAAHTVHALGGVLAILRFGSRASLFWHFVGALWIYVLFLCGVWA